MDTDIAVLYLTEVSWLMDRYVNMILVLLDSEIISILSEHGFLCYMVYIFVIVLFDVRLLCLT
jgi:hypothetical protein